jgi:hypothetical protein
VSTTSQYSCLSCGAHIEVRETSTWVGMTFIADATVSHDGPEDAACEWVVQVLSDETRALLNFRVRQMRDSLR